MGTSQVPRWALGAKDKAGNQAVPALKRLVFCREAEVRDALVWACVMPRGRGPTGGKRRGGLQARSTEVRSFEAGVSNAKRAQSLYAKPP